MYIYYDFVLFAHITRYEACHRGYFKSIYFFLLGHYSLNALIILYTCFLKNGKKSPVANDVAVSAISYECKAVG